MNIKEFISSLWEKYSFKLKIIKKWIFWILLDEDAFYIAKEFNLKITILDKETIKVWFPDGSKNKWLAIFKEKNIWYFIFEKEENNFVLTNKYNWEKYTKNFRFDLEDYNLTKQRILWLNKIWLELKNEKNFLLKEKTEEIYIIIMQILLKLPKKERYFFREKIERLFLDLFEEIYIYMYDLDDRKIIIKNIFNKVLILREFHRFLYKISIIKNDNVYLDIWDRFVEVLKICKWIKSKNTFKDYS